ncbi:MAG: hypothetical protein U0263_32070 [Polyangiaceae bacterium]
MHTLYAYVHGSDLDDIAELLLRDLQTFVRQTPWKTAEPSVVSQRSPADPTLASGDVPDWDLGLNLPLPLGPSTAIDDAVTIAQHLVELRARVSRDFVIGLHDDRTGATEDLFFVDSHTLDVDSLRAALA